MAGGPNDQRGQLEQLFKQQNPGVLESLPAAKRGQIIGAVQRILTTETFAQVHTEFRSHSGPLPPAEELLRYNEAAPNAADRIIAMAEKQQEHRIKLETNTIASQQNQSARGQIIGGLLAGLLVIAGTWLAVTGHDAVAGVVFGTTVIGLASLFVLGRVLQKKNLANKQ